MWTYTKCTSKDREEKLNKLTEAFAREKDCSRYLSDVQKFINSTQTTIVLLQDVEDNVLIEMDYVPVNDYVFHVVNIEENGIKKQGRVFLELGGNDSFIVLEDADLELAVNEAVGSRMGNAGQICCASKRFLIHETLKDEFVKKLKDKINGMKIGDPDRKSVV